MRLIEAMKALKRLSEKVTDLRSKITTHCAILEHEEPPYGAEQRATVDGWRQSAVDTIAEIARLRMAITRTNLQTAITVTIGDKAITKPLAYWVLRRRELAQMEAQLWFALSDRGLKPQAYKTTDENGHEQVGLHQIVRFFDIKQRDSKLSDLREEPALIDAALEIANATTELIEE